MLELNWWVWQLLNRKQQESTYSQINEVKLASTNTLLSVWSLITAFDCHCKYCVRPRAVCIHVRCTNDSCLSQINARLLATKYIPNDTLTCIQQAVWPPGPADMVCPRPPLTLTCDRLTLKLICESHLRWGSFLPNLDMLGLWVLELFPMHATDRQTDGQIKAMPIAPSLWVGHNNKGKCVQKVQW